MVLLNRTGQPTTEIVFNSYRNWTRRPWYLKAERVGSASWTEPYEFVTEKGIGITFAKPMYDNGNLTSIVAVDLVLTR